MVAKPPSACSKCSPSRWNAGDMGCVGCSGRRFGHAGSWRGVFCAAACRVRRASVRAAGMIEPTVGAFCGAAREGGASWCVLVTYFCAAAGEVLPRMVRFFCGGIGWVSCARVPVGTIDRTVGAGVPMQPFPNRRKCSRRRHTRRALLLGSRVHASWWCRSLVRPSTRASEE